MGETLKNDFLAGGVVHPDHLNIRPGLIGKMNTKDQSIYRGLGKVDSNYNLFHDLAD
jgi:hypothetical protein